MKKFFTIFSIVLASFAAGCTEAYDDSEIRSDITNLQERVDALE